LDAEIGDDFHKFSFPNTKYTKKKFFLRGLRV